MRIEDEDGNPWLVLPGDGAAEQVAILRRAGYDYIVLTRTILCGTMEFLPCEPPLRHLSATPQGVVRAFRLYDCLTELSKEKRG